MTSKTFCGSLAAAAWLGITAEAAMIHVPADHPTIQQGIDAASPYDTVVVAPGTYAGAGNTDLNFGGKPIVVVSEAGPETTIISCEGAADNRHRGAKFRSGEGPASVLEGFTITDGWAPLDDTVIFDIYVWIDSKGGGIFIRGASPTIRNCIIDSCRSDHGGGGFDVGNSDPTIENTVVRGCQGDAGGGMSIGSSQAIITGCLIENNLARHEGGGMALWASAPSITSTTIVANSADLGGGFFLYNSSPSLDRTIVAFQRSGGSIYCSISGTENYPTASCSDFYQGVGSPAGCLGTLIGVDGNFSADPLFCDTAAHSYALLDGSPCLPAGNSCAVLIGAPGTPCACCIVRGDVNHSSGPGSPVRVSDLTYLIALLYFGGSAPVCPEEGDVDSNGAINLADLTFLVAYLFQGGPAPGSC